MKKKLTHLDIVFLCVWIMVVLASVKSIFTDTGFDNAYTVAMAYRHLNGDAMFSTMWEPHQTSIFFTDILMWSYRLIVPSFEGVVLYLQICGTILFYIVSIPLYKLIYRISGKYVSMAATILFIMLRVKQSPFPDYSNLQICFSMLLFVSLANYILVKPQIHYLCFASLFLFLTILAYPSCIILYFPTIIILALYSKRRIRDIIIVTITCLTFGCLYILYFLSRLGASQFIAAIKYIFLSDTHSKEIVMYNNYFQGVIPYLLWIIISFLVASIVSLIKRNKDIFMTIWGIVLVLSEIILVIIMPFCNIDWTCSIYIIPIFLISMGIVFYKVVDKNEFELFAISLWLSGFSFISTILLTDLSFITVLPYLIVGGTASLVVLNKLKINMMPFIVCICLLIVVHRGYVVWGYANKANQWTVTQIESYVSKGPSKGILCDRDTSHRNVNDIEDNMQFMNENDTVLFVGGWLIDPIEFLLTNAKIGNHSTIDTPLYNEVILDYFRINPKKEPTIIAISSWDSIVERTKENEWIVDWAECNYEMVGNGHYWNYYRKK